MALTYSPKNRLRVYRLTDVLFLILLISAVVIWYTQETPAPPPDPLEVKVEELTRSLESLDEQQQGTVGYLIQQQVEEENYQRSLRLTPEEKQ